MPNLTLEKVLESCYSIDRFTFSSEPIIPNGEPYKENWQLNWENLNESEKKDYITAILKKFTDYLELNKKTNDKIDLEFDLDYNLALDELINRRKTYIGEIELSWSPYGKNDENLRINVTIPAGNFGSEKERYNLFLATRCFLCKIVSAYNGKFEDRIKATEAIPKLESLKSFLYIFKF